MLLAQLVEELPSGAAFAAMQLFKALPNAFFGVLQGREIEDLLRFVASLIRKGRASVVGGSGHGFPFRW